MWVGLLVDLLDYRNSSKFVQRDFFYLGLIVGLEDVVSLFLDVKCDSFGTGWSKILVFAMRIQMYFTIPYQC